MNGDGARVQYSHALLKSRLRRALLRRIAAQRPNRLLPLLLCASCHRRRRLGDRGWALWYCRPCWTVWYRKHKQWYLWDLEPQECSTCRGRSSPGWWDRRHWHCVACWGKWFNSRGTRSNLDENHVHFIEIGTSNYQTLTQACAGHPDGDRHAWKYLPLDEAPQNLRGLAIDMEQSCLEELPDLPNVKKVCSAVTECSGQQLKLHVPHHLITYWEHIFATCGNEDGWYVMQLARACSSLGEPRLLQRRLTKIGLGRLLRRRSIYAESLPTLLERYQVGSIGVLKLDSEGHDCAILKGFVRGCEFHASWYPQIIVYETNGMNDHIFGNGTEKQMADTLQRLNYEIVYCSGSDTVAIRKT